MVVHNLSILTFTGLNVETLSSSEILVTTYQTTRRRDLEDNTRH